MDRLIFTSPNADREIRLTGVTILPRVWEITETTQPPGRMAIASPRRVDGVQLFGKEARVEYDINGGPATRRFVAATTASHLVPRGGRRDMPPSDVDPAIGNSLKGAGLGAHLLVIGHRR